MLDGVRYGPAGCGLHAGLGPTHKMIPIKVIYTFFFLRNEIWILCEVEEIETSKLK